MEVSINSTIKMLDIKFMRKVKTMRRVLFAVIVCAFMATPVLADYYGGRVNWGRVGGYYSGNGGEFSLSSDGGPGLLLSNSAYADTTRGEDGNPESFQTFCIERGEYVAQPMDIMVSTTWTSGSIPQWDTIAHSPASHAIQGGEDVGDDLNPATAYLYTQFATGVLSDYDYLSAGVGRNVSAGQLQKAIWSLEGELSLAASDIQAQAWVTEATGSGWDDIGNVRILNSWVIDHVGEEGYWKQDQLYLTPVPSSVLLGILGLGVTGLKLRRFA